MTRSITETLLSVPDPGWAGRISDDIKQHAQRDVLFHLAVLQSARSAQLKRHFAGRMPRRLFIGANLSGFGYQRPGFEVGVLDAAFFREPDPAQRAAKQQQLADAVVVVNNNDVGREGGAPFFADFVTRCDRTLFVVWDWDNHHWLDNSTFAAAHADLYAPAHHENLYLMTRYHWSCCGPVYCATVQWPRRFLADRVDLMLQTERSDQPLGMHVPYAPFTFRNRVVTTLGQHFPQVGFSSHAFHGRGAEDRLLEWCRHKLHWIVPVLNDVPIRLFDALITGGIPIVPESLRYLPPVDRLDRRHVEFYGPEDIVNPRPVWERALRKFEAAGREGIVERHRLAMEQHHGDQRVDAMLERLAEKFELDLPAR